MKDSHKWIALVCGAELLMLFVLGCTSTNSTDMFSSIEHTSGACKETYTSYGRERVCPLAFCDDGVVCYVGSIDGGVDCFRDADLTLNYCS